MTSNDPTTWHQTLCDIILRPGAHFTNDFSIIIKIRWKIFYVAIYFLAITSLQRFAHATTAQLLCHVKNIVTITLLDLGESKIKFPSNLNSVGNIFSETGPSPMFGANNRTTRGRRSRLATVQTQIDSLLTGSTKSMLRP